MCTLTIIIPTFNSAKTLANCLHSIVNQTFTDFEILLIDGKSTDATLKIIEQYQRKYDNLKFISEKDNGVYDAMNKGVVLAKGEWLYFLGSDDELFESSTLVKVYDAIKVTSYQIIYGNVLVNGDSGWARDGQVYDGEFNISKIINKNICHQSIFYHKKTFEELGLYNEKYKICADHDFNIRCCAKFKYRYLNLIIAKFHGGGKSSTPDHLFIEDYDQIIISNHIKTLFKLKINNEIFLKNAKLAFHLNKKGLFIYLMMLYIYKKKITRLLLKIKQSL